MTVTASRLGSAPLTLDWSNLVRVPPLGRAGKPWEPDREELSSAWGELKARFSSGEVGFYDAPMKNEISQAAESIQLAETLMKKRPFRNCLFLGIGGSSLGPLTLLSALHERCNSGLKFHFMENPDPIEWKTTLSHLDPETTLVCAVTKSGTTFETIAQLLLVMEWLGRERLRTNLVAITDPAKGDLCAFAKQEDLPTLHIAPSIGGRFSVFSPVGLFPAALAGLNIAEFVQGAKQVRDYMEKAPVEKNPMMILGQELIRHFPGRSVHVCMPYSTRLRSFGQWYVQLWGESLGKDGKGFTPLAAVGATDQHSILQLLRDGPDDKVTTFLTVDQMGDEVKIPRTYPTKGKASFDSFKLLEGHSLQELLTTEYRATALVLAKRNRPTISVQLDRLDERAMGSLFFAFSCLTAVTGTLWKVNPFDQPGVEEGKIYIRQSLSQGGQSRAASEETDENSAVNRLRRAQSGGQIE
jgi:glucose-6-phosphate isomerase